METYRRVLAELSSMDFAGRFSPYLQSEPLLDKRLPMLIRMAREQLPKAKLLVQSNGDLLTVPKAIALFEAGLHKLIINCYDNDHGRLSRLRALADELAERIPDVRHLRRGFYSMVRTEQPGKVRKEIVVEDKTRWTADGQENWAGNVPGIHLVREPMKAWCFRPFHQLYVHYNGNVVLCCCDWKGEVVFGNINDQSLGEIFDSQLARAYRTKLKNKDRHMKLCDVCDFRGGYKLYARVGHFVSGLTRYINRDSQ
jgi:radical SAM protein with 4Fe4S-binding SPASM domain